MKTSAAVTWPWLVAIALIAPTALANPPVCATPADQKSADGRARPSQTRCAENRQDSVQAACERQADAMRLTGAPRVNQVSACVVSGRRQY